MKCAKFYAKIHQKSNLPILAGILYISGRSRYTLTKTHGRLFGKTIEKKTVRFDFQGKVSLMQTLEALEDRGEGVIQGPPFN